MPLVTRPYPGARLPYIPETPEEHAQQVVSRCVLTGFRYGPMHAYWDPDLKVMVVTNEAWKPYTREPLPSVRRQWGDDFGTYPPGAACSTFAAYFTALYLNARDKYDPGWGGGMADAVRTDSFLKKRVTYLHPGSRGWWREWEWDKLPDRLPEPVSLAFYAGHVVVALDADALELRHPRTAERLSGVWVMGADGWFKDRDESEIERHDNGVPDDRDDDVRLYNAQELTFEPAEKRAEREGSRRKRKRRFALVGLASTSRAMMHKNRPGISPFRPGPFPHTSTARGHRKCPHLNAACVRA